MHDPQGGGTTTWNAKDVDNVTRMRGYMTHLAWQVKAPNWSTAGMMDVSPSVGVKLQTETDALNWEASGENSSTWASYFYVYQWWNNVSSANLHSDIVSDLWNNNVPVAAEVDASEMPNWPQSNTNIHHFITIIGYDDNASTCQYTDTCANSTNCGSLNDRRVQTVLQGQHWNPVTAIPVNVNTGDGGWIW